VTALVWFRRDLRLHDHPALRAALDAHDEVVPFFCLDDRLLHGRHASGPRTQFLLECLAELPLEILRGKPEEEIPRLAKRVGANEVHFTGDISPFARSRRVEGLECFAHPGLTVVDDVKSIKPYKVYSPFYRHWKELPRREVIGKPRLSGEAKVPTLGELGLRQEVEEPLPGGEKAGRKRMLDWVKNGVHEYDRRQDQLADDKTSRLSPYLHFGCISPRELESLVPDGAFRRQLAWRDFYHHVLYHFPRNAKSEFQDRYRGTIRWSYAEKAFQRWTRGQTGFPLVDAGMRQLLREGWMHNRARLVVGSFLTKDLGIDWRWGERWFMRLLIDGDEANNNGNWQWIASVGVDPQPAYRRMYNPARHMERFDARGEYVRRYVPELRDVPDEHLAEPWEMPSEVQEEAGCVIGRDYPEPMVDRKQARQRALERYRV
jgi:deoxyribodipyrimidine photo-lyase